MELDVKRRAWSIRWSARGLSLLLAALCFLLVGLALSGLTASPLDTDEAFSVNLALLPWGAAWSGAVADASHPPIFTMLLKQWIVVGGWSLLWLRLLAAVASCLLLIPFFLLVREFSVSRGAAALALAALIASGTRVYYSHIVRSYAILMLLSALSIWLFAHNTRKEKVGKMEFAGYCAVNLAMCWMHYFGLWVVCIQLLLAIAVYRKELVRTLISVCLVFASFLIWLPSAVRIARAQDGLKSFIGWMEQPTLANLAWFYNALIGAPDLPHALPLAIVLFVVPLAVWCARGAMAPRELPAGNNRILVHLLPVAVLPAAGTFLLSRLGSLHLFADRVLIFAIVPYCFLIAVAVTKIRPRFLKAGVSCALFAWAVLGTFAAASKMNTSDTRWDAIAACVAGSEDSPAPVHATEWFISTPYQMYLRMKGLPADHVTLGETFLPAPDRFWAAYRIFRTRPAYSQKVREDLLNAGYTPVKRCITGGDGAFYRVVFDLEVRATPPSSKP
jgi:hypothetical protein